MFKGPESRARTVLVKLESNSEPERARVSQRVPVRASGSQNGSHREPERETGREPERARESHRESHLKPMLTMLSKIVKIRTKS